MVRFGLYYPEDDEGVPQHLRDWLRARRIRLNRERAATFIIRRLGRRIAIARRPIRQARRAAARFAIRSPARRALLRRYWFRRRYPGAAAAA